MTKISFSASPKMFLSTVVLQVGDALSPVALAWITRDLIDTISQRGGDNVTLSGKGHEIAVLLAGMVLLMTLSRILAPLSAFLVSDLGRHVRQAVQTSLLRSLGAIHGLAPFENPKVHNDIQLAIQGGDRGPAMTVSVFASVARSCISLLGFLALLVSFSPVLILAVLVTVIPEAISRIVLSKQRFELAESTIPQIRRSAYVSSIVTSPAFAKEVRLFGLADYFVSRFGMLSQSVNQAERLQQKRELRWQVGLTVCSGIATGGAISYVGLKAYHGTVSAGDIILYLGAVAAVQGAVSGVILGLAQLREGALFFERFERVKDISQPLPLSPIPRQVPELRNGIEIRNVSFRYDEAQPWVLEDINLFIPAKTSIALVGLNGAGKSTILKLLMRFYDPSVGQILWDGHDIREFDPLVLRRRMSATFQDFVKFDLSARENIGLGNLGMIHDTDAVLHAASRVGVNTALQKLPNGLETMLSLWLDPAGKNSMLSGGEWQKIALSRMIMRDAEILLLDEPTASIDPQSEHELVREFVEILSGKTGIVISHRLSTARVADRIVVLENGRIVERGTHKELMRLCGRYFQLFEMQASTYR